VNTCVRISFDLAASQFHGSYVTGIAASPKMFYIVFPAPGYLVAYVLATYKIARTRKGDGRSAKMVKDGQAF
jgi:hypothetical protein